MMCWLLGHLPVWFRVHGPDSDPIHRYGGHCMRCKKPVSRQ